MQIGLVVQLIEDLPQDTSILYYV